MKLDIIESLTYTASIQWQPHTSGEVGHFFIENENYTITINFQELNLPQRSKNLEVSEISFQRIINNQSTVIQTQSAHASKVFGTVYNASLDMIKKHKPDIIIYSAKYQNDEGNKEIFNKRVRIYSRLAHRLAQHGVYNQLSHEPLKSTHALNFILIKSDIEISTDELNYIKQKI